MSNKNKKFSAVQSIDHKNAGMKSELVDRCNKNLTVVVDVVADLKTYAISTCHQACPCGFGTPSLCR